MLYPPVPMTHVDHQRLVAASIRDAAPIFGLTLAKAGGADPAQVRKAIAGGICDSRILELHGQRMIDRNFVPGGFIKNQIKDLKAALEVAEKIGIAIAADRKGLRNVHALAQIGKEELDHSALILQIEAMKTSAKGPRFADVV